MTKIDQTQSRPGVSEQPAVAEHTEQAAAAGPQQQTGSPRGGDDFINKAARTAGEVVGGVREMIGSGAIDAVGRHKGKIALAAGVIYAPGMAALAGAVAAGRAVQNGIEGKFAGKSLSEAVRYQADDFKGLKDDATRKTIGVLKNVFGFGAAAKTDASEKS